MRYIAVYNGVMPLKINLKNLLFYLGCALFMLLSNCAVRGAPLSLGIFFAMLVCGTNIIATPALFILSSVINLNLIFSAVVLFEALFLSVTVFLYRRSGRKIKFEALFYLIIALAPYVIFCTFRLNDLGLNEYLVRSLAALVVLAFTFFCFKSVYALMYRIERCRLKEDELISLALVYAVCGSGLYSLLGEPFYIIWSAFWTVFSVRLCRSPAAFCVALILALPPATVTLNAEYLTYFLIISIITLLLSGAGRFAAGGACAALSAGLMYMRKCFYCPVPLIVLYSVLLFTACFIPSLPKPKFFENLKMRLLVTGVLTETAVARSQRNTAEKLYRISEVFREIERAFTALDEEVSDGTARVKMFQEVKEKCCSGCERKRRCETTNVYTGFKKLIDAGCVKGKVNLIDLPSEMTLNCSRPTDVLSSLNGVLIDYRRLMTETENARSGRKLLAEQARGVSVVLKSCAVDLNRARSFSGAAESVKKALAAGGISCPEISIGEDGDEVSTVVTGKTDVNIMCKIISKTLGKRFVLKDKIVYGGEKSCLIFGAPPKTDAAFGVAYAIKSGEKVSGDTHSVIRINDHSFLMALSDGMGSGEYARKVSESAISLIEAFYRAEVPRDTVLQTINKLLSFNRDERFTCIDIACVDLNTGRADFVKIGSPAGVIVREGEIKVLESASLPLGILENLRPAVCTEHVKSGDIIVFMSDGITSAFPSAADLYEFLQQLRPLNPQNLADKILAAALDRTNHIPLDDMTVICTRIFDNSEQ